QIFAGEHASAAVTLRNAQQNGASENGHHRVILSERDKSVIEKNRLDARLKAIEIDQKMGELIPREAVNREIDTANQIVVAELRKSLGLELPPRLEGLSAVEIKKKLLAKLDVIFEGLPKKFENAQAITAA
ncbi:MAG: hypothetical protein HRJ53_27650, partial [Acidobacteria bacterium Pan2503]|nr:hypothetical protein [Candidatus Acidoferrum panamensis]